MRLVSFTDQQLVARIKVRPAEYLSEIEPSIVRNEQGQFIDLDHPAYKAAKRKYAPVGHTANTCPRCGAPLVGGCRKSCHQCGYAQGCGD